MSAAVQQRLKTYVDSVRPSERGPMRACLAMVQCIQRRSADIDKDLVVPLCRMHALMPETMARYVSPPRVLRSCRLFYRAITPLVLDEHDVSELAGLLGASADDAEAAARGLALDDKDAVLSANWALFQGGDAASTEARPEPAAPGPVPFSASLMTFDRDPEPLAVVMRDADLAVEDVRKIAPDAAAYIAATRTANAPQNSPLLDGLLAALHRILGDLQPAPAPSDTADSALAAWWTRRAFAALYGSDDALHKAHPTKSSTAFFDAAKRTILEDPSQALDPIEARGVGFEDLASAAEDQQQDLGTRYVATVDALLQDAAKPETLPPNRLLERRAALRAVLGYGSVADHRAALEALLFEADVLPAFDRASQVFNDTERVLRSRNIKPSVPGQGPYLELVKKASPEAFQAIVESIDAHAERYGGQLAWLLGQLDAETVARHGRGVAVTFAAWADALYDALYGSYLPRKIKTKAQRRTYIDEVAEGELQVSLEHHTQKVLPAPQTSQVADAELRKALLSGPPPGKDKRETAFAKWLASRTDRPAAMALDLLHRELVSHPDAARAAVKAADDLLEAAERAGLTIESSSALTKWFAATLYRNVYGLPATVDEFNGMLAALTSGREAPAAFEAPPQVRRRKLEARPGLTPIALARPQQKHKLDGPRTAPGIISISKRKRSGLSFFGKKKPLIMPAPEALQSSQV